MDVEKRLRAFRRERQRKETLEEVKNIIAKPFNVFRNRMIGSSFDKNESPEIRQEGSTFPIEDAETDVLLGQNINDEGSDGSVTQGLEIAEEDDSLMGLHGLTKYLTYFALWAVPYILLIKVGFGAVYFCVTALLFIYFNTRTRPKLPNEPSAYSVFNVNCQPIEGALSGEDIEKQIRSGMMYDMLEKSFPRGVERPKEMIIPKSQIQKVISKRTMDEFQEVSAVDCGVTC